MRSGFLPARVVHVHPTRACNLSCGHCYSSSSPAARGELDVESLVGGLARLRQEGYEVVSVSGGEPLVYRPLPRLVAAAAGMGYRVHMITNGILLDRRRISALAEHVGLFGVSLDGAEETHNRVRGRSDAYARALRALHLLAEAQVPFAIVFAATARSLPEIPAAFELARELGASVLHLRPLAPEGRARELDSSWALTIEDCARLHLLARLLNTVDAAGPRIQVDLVPLGELLAARGQFELLHPDARVAQLSDAVNPLVIDEMGRCFPFSYGIGEALELGRLGADGTFTDFPPSRETLARIAGLLDAAFREAEDEGTPYVDWFAHLARVSRLSAAGPAATPLPVLR